MKIFLTDQTYRFDKHLNDLMERPVMKYIKENLKEKTSIIDLGTTRSLQQADLTFLFDYKIFPTNIMMYKTQWQREHRKMRTGDTIVQQALIPPVKAFAQKIIFGVRINKIIDEAYRKGFSYETLTGHVERGESTFTIERMEKKLIFKINTFSLPGNFLMKLAGSVFTVPYQTYCTRRALENVCENFNIYN